MKHSEMKAEQDATFTVDVVVLVDAVFLISICMRWKLQRTSRKKLHCSSQLSALWKVGKTTIESLPRLLKLKFWILIQLFQFKTIVSRAKWDWCKRSRSLDTIDLINFQFSSLKWCRLLTVTTIWSWWSLECPRGSWQQFVSWTLSMHEKHTSARYKIWSNRSSTWSKSDAITLFRLP